MEPGKPQQASIILSLLCFSCLSLAMPKNKVKLAFISNYHARRTSLKKRKDSLKKKLNELCTLCDIEACAIMYSPNESHPDLWPSKEGVENVVDQFHKIPKMEQSKKM